MLQWIYTKGLHVHHSYYNKDLFPWEYPPESLSTLCWICHKKLHEHKQIPVIDSNNRQIGVYNPCTRCFGAGYFPQFRHIEEGICFKCKGAKYEELTI